MQSIPIYSKDLIEQLDKDIPRPLFKPGEDFDEFLMHSGARRLIEILIVKLKRTEEEGLNYVRK